MSPKKSQRTIDEPSTANDRRQYFYQLIAIAILANDVVESSKETTQYSVSVSRRKLNALKEALQGLKST